MGRYRPPQAKSTPYITSEGYTALEKELKAIWIKRDEVTKAVTAAAAEGDRSENAEYIYRKKQLREIDRRIRYLQKRLPDLTVVDRIPDNQDQIFFGAWIRLEDDEGEEFTYRIVGPDEFDVDSRYISLDAPLAKALLKKYLDDSVTVTTPAGEKHFLIAKVSYNNPQSD
ncbi:MAG: transcription elongation factor GreB [Gammaproteobacteria bacterium]|nr:transcription elongation factor GreB [Gammaproteobacteria bacterium]